MKTSFLVLFSLFISFCSLGSDESATTNPIDSISETSEISNNQTVNNIDELLEAIKSLEVK